ncbi:uncharacterized protein LOC118233567 [Anguilla anguilla]|uniref:uncharacterized protein LOC118233567 n=1 Tax=Anguilla anguilla TaxID=7936 RepID=UPI0015AFD8A9|nr:uncharacterized protein LOC118233567 [Anguilla anguilla]
MDPNRSEAAQPLVALARMLEGMAQMQERQAAVHAEQMEALRAQASLQTQALRQLAAAGETSSRDPPSRSPLRIHIPKMTADDDIQAFVESFEVAAEACQWPHEEWVVHLLPLLTGEAQQAAHGLPPGARADYKTVKRAILDRLGCSPEDYRRRFRTAKLGAEDRPFAYAQRLTHMARRWLQPEIRSAGGVVEQVVLEQFLEGLPEGTANWVRCHRPTNLEGAVTLAEDHLVLYPSVQQQARPEPAPRRRPPPRTGPSPVPRALPPPFPQTNPPFFPIPSPGPGSVAGGSGSQRAPQTLGPGCWRCGQLGHLRRDCPLMEVGQVVRVVGPPTSAPDQEGAYCIPTDASDRGLGAVLTQQVEGVDRPVLYLSRKLSQREARYSTVEKECLAIRWAVGSLRYYLLGRPFTLCSDHAPLQWLHRMKDTNPRITRWYLALQPFNFKVVHRPGAQMVVADFLSRGENIEEMRRIRDAFDD